MKPHGKGQAAQLNYLLDAGGFVVKPDGTFAVDFARVRRGVTGSTREIMTIQAEGNYAKAGELGQRFRVVRDSKTKALLDKMNDIPIDIQLRFTHRGRICCGKVK